MCWTAVVEAPLSATRAAAAISDTTVVVSPTCAAGAAAVTTNQNPYPSAALDKVVAASATVFRQ